MKKGVFQRSVFKRALAVTLSVAMACSAPSAVNLTAHAAAKKYVGLNTTFKTLKTGQSGYKLRLKNNVIGWKIQNVSSTDQSVAVAYKKAASYVLLKGKQEGRTTIKLGLKTNKRKKYNTKTLKCRVRVIPADTGQDSSAAPDPSVTPDAAAESSAAVSVATPAELSAALADKNHTSITIRTNAAESFVIPEGTYSKTDLVVDAPNSDVENRGLFQSVAIHAIKSSTWTEYASGNTITATAAAARVVVAKDAVIKKLVFTTVDADVRLQVDGTISLLVINARMKLSAAGSAVKKIPVTVAAAAADAEMTSSVPMDVTAEAGFALTLKPGAEDSSLRIQSLEAAVLLNNDTTKRIEVTKASGSRIYISAGTHTKITENSSSSYGSSAIGSGSSYGGSYTPSGGTNTPSGGTNTPSGGTNTSAGGTDRPSANDPSDTDHPSTSDPSDTDHPSTSDPSGGETEEEDTTAVTRGQWVQLLAEAVGINLDADMSSIKYYYADTKASQYAAAVETAQMYNLLPPVMLEDERQDVPFFSPDAPATREFAAYTVIAAMGYKDEPSVEDWEDWAAVTYKQAAALAVSQGFMELSGTKFMPNAPLTVSQAKKLQNRIKSLKESVTVKDADRYDRSVYAQTVEEEAFASVDNYQVEQSGTNETKVTIPAENNIPKAEQGKTILLPQTDDYPAGLAVKIESVQTQADGSKVYTCSTPEPADVFDKIDFAGNAAPLINKIEGTGNVGVLYNDQTGSSRSFTRANIDINTSTSVPDKFTFVFPEDGLVIGSGSEEVTIKGSVEAEIPDVSCIVNADVGRDGITFHELTFSVTKKVKIFEQLFVRVGEYETGNPGTLAPVKKEIGRVPFVIGNTGLSGNLVFYINVTAKGEVHVNYEFESMQGFQYKDGVLRWLHDYNDTLNDLQANGSAYLTSGMDIQLKVLGFLNLAEVSLEGGAGIQAAFIKRNGMDPVLYCSDLTAYPVLKLALGENTAAGRYFKQKGYPLAYSLFDESVPFIRMHMENGKKVDVCTYGKGILTGKVIAYRSKEAINGARVQIYQGEELIQTQYTSADGMYTIQNLEAGTYRIDISANGYQRYTNEGIVIEKNQTTQAGTAEMVSRTDATGILKGRILEAILSDQTISGAAFEVREGWNITAGEVYEEGTFDDSGSYELTLPAGNYTLLINKEGYVKNLVNIAIEEGVTTLRDITLVPTGSYDENYVRIVLTWGENPRDLDSHLFGPPQDGDTNTYFHTFYANKNYDYNETIANLDVDDVTSYGPETTTIFVRNPAKKYSFFVHDYTNISSTSSTALASSGAQVQVFIGNELKRTFNVPVAQEGTVWHVFDYDANGDVITPVNTFHYSSNPGSLDITPFSLSPEDMMLQELAELPEK